MIIKGEITNKEITEGKSKTDKLYRRAVFTINEKNWSTFDKSIMEEFEKGNYVEIETETKGAFENMKSMKIIEKDEEPEVVKVTKNGLVDNQLRISRMNCIGNALKFYEVSKLKFATPNDVIAVAENFLSYINE